MYVAVWNDGTSVPCVSLEALLALLQRRCKGAFMGSVVDHAGGMQSAPLLNAEAVAIGVAVYAPVER